jgi:hypothetical protein
VSALLDSRTPTSTPTSDPRPPTDLR